jgi:hypothetical protein
MTTWTSDELDRIGNAEELRLATQRPDGTLRDPVTIWVIRYGNDLYVRSWRGPGGLWFRRKPPSPGRRLATTRWD